MAGILDLPYPRPLIEGTFIRRRDRFIADIALRISDPPKEVACHCINPGRMEAFVIPGATVWVLPAILPAVLPAVLPAHVPAVLPAVAATAVAACADKLRKKKETAKQKETAKNAEKKAKKTTTVRKSKPVNFANI